MWNLFFFFLTTFLALTTGFALTLGLEPGKSTIRINNTVNSNIPSQSEFPTQDRFPIFFMSFFPKTPFLSIPEGKMLNLIVFFILLGIAILSISKDLPKP
ncbi:cation:dicarboxylase symporter family transporter, partial [Leptospira borgpetersenii serovar Hardjo-bovis]|nr:cation:dicarboxylase symporter family transporter [Leptospira borgpetersenii serovar Hardjo-bovis]